MTSRLPIISSQKVLGSNMQIRNLLSDVLSVLGALSISAGAFLIAPWLGMIVIGLALLAISYFMR